MHFFSLDIKSIKLCISEGEKLLPSCLRFKIYVCVVSRIIAKNNKKKIVAGVNLTKILFLD